ncbi:MAG: hydrogenase maturation nickel metallochaperone HypA [Chromatiales bacterium]|nr:hydrogenase maturation nickel metallochaperone HypA [Gammaproteobacteria bacterium]MCP5352309.1 hydrogenase maturation nickel metallochaperone HypA [Chromatiales bacterium]
MHEMSLCESVVEILAEEARRQGFQRVKTVWLEIGRLASADPEAIRFCFDAVTRATVADGARLEIIDTPGQAWCERCAVTVEIKQRFDACPVCGDFPLRVIDGDALRVKQLEVE